MKICIIVTKGEATRSSERLDTREKEGEVISSSTFLCLSEAEDSGFASNNGDGEREKVWYER